MTGRKLMLTLLALLAVVSVSARKINVYGLITIKGSNEPASGASIIDANTRKLIAIAGEDGKFNVNVDSEAELIFSFMATEEHREKVKGRHLINIRLMPHTTSLNEVVVMAKGRKATLMTERTDLDVAGNTLRFKTKVKLPAKMFNTEKRIIVQPAVYNVTRKHLSYLKPVVFDGWRYAATQERMYDWKKNLDSLTNYQQIKHTPRHLDNTIYLLDSMYVENPKDDFMGLIFTSLENYNKILYTDTFEVARGTVNPLRFLSYSLKPVQLTEERFRPTPEVELRDTKGEMNLVFPVGKSTLNLAMGNNAAELEALVNEFRKIEQSPDMSLKSFSINGYASPEGRYEQNQALAEARMKSAMETVMSNVDPSLRRNAEISSHADVASWDEVVKMLRADGLNDEADKVQNAINSGSNNGQRARLISRLPFYKSLIAEKYLPRLRRVNYHILSSVYRPLNDEEIAELYKANPDALTKYQYYRYYTSKEGAERESALRKALSTHPDFVAAATDLSEILINRGEDATAAFEAFYKTPEKWNRLPESTRLNMGIASMNAMRFAQADSILSTLPDTPDTHKAKIYAAAQNGRFQDVIEEINEDSPLNEVLVLLAAKNNTFAWEKARHLGDSAVELYVKAIASNRLDKYMEANAYLEQAFELDSSLREIAKVDGDVIDLLDETDRTKTNE